MRALVIYCHPRPDSYTAAVRDVVLARLSAAGAELRLRDLYAEGFDPALGAAAHAGYGTDSPAAHGVGADCADLLWADTLIFVYPTWWYGLPAVLKGWLDRVMLPGIAFLMPRAEGETIRPGLTHITRMGVFTTCGASRLLTLAVGAPADLVLFDADAPFVLNRFELRSKSKNTPFDEARMQGKVLGTWVGGARVFG